MKKCFLVLAVLLCVFMTGCSSKYMAPVGPEAVVDTVSQGEAVIVFFRATSFGGAVQAPVIESVDDKLQFVAIVSAGMKIMHRTTPGKHLYMVAGESSEILEADLAEGKTYYTYVSPRFGFAKARFVFVPVTAEKAATEEFKKDLAWCSWFANKPESEQWFQENMPSLKAKFAEALKNHHKAYGEDKKMLTPGDGLTVPVR